MDADREEWLRARKKGLGGSDAAAVMGKNPFCSPYALWVEKTNKDVIDNSTSATRWGTRLEPVVRDAYAEEVGRTVDPGVTLVQHPQEPWMFANTDGTIPFAPEHAGPGVYEGKVTTVFNAQAWKEGPPLYHQIQVHHYCIVLSYQWGSIAGLIMGDRDDPLVWDDIEVNEDFAYELMEAEYKFWHRHVLRDVPPPVDGSVSTERVLKLLHPKDTGRVIVLGADLVKTADEDRRLQRVITRAQKDRRAYSNRIRAAMGDASYAKVLGEDGEVAHLYSYKHQDSAVRSSDLIKVLSDTLGDDATAELVQQAQEKSGTQRVLRKAAAKTVEEAEESYGKADQATG